MRFTNPFVRSFLAGLIWYTLVLFRIASINSYSLATIPVGIIFTLLTAWFITALLVGLLGDKRKIFRPWPGQIISTMACSLLVMAIMLKTAEINTANPSKLPEFENTDQMMVYMANEAARWMKQDKNIALDYSFESIKAIETRLGEISKDVVKDNPQKGTFGISLGYGAYIGEVFRRQCGGSWAKSDKFGGENSYPLTTRSNNVAYPVMWCYKRLINGEEDNVYFKAMSFNEINGNPTNRLNLKKATLSPSPQGTN